MRTFEPWKGLDNWFFNLASYAMVVGAFGFVAYAHTFGL